MVAILDHLEMGSGRGIQKCSETVEVHPFIAIARHDENRTAKLSQGGFG